MDHSDKPVRWMQRVLLAAGVYNILWGAWVVLFPNALWLWVGAEPPNYPQLWQCIGMIVGVYGIGYLAAALHPLRHWPIVLVGFLGKVLGPLGFAHALWTGAFPAAFGWTILTNDLIWWIPFALILRTAWLGYWGQQERQYAAACARFDHVIASARTNGGQTLKEMSAQNPLLLVFLRHFGCTFCREALADIAAKRAEIEASGTKLVLVHMLSEDDAIAYFAEAKLADVAHLSDPTRHLYWAFQLRRGTVGQLFGPQVWVRGFIAGILQGHGVGRLAGDGLQMPGVFLLYQGRVVRAFRHSSAGERPDYVALAATP